MPTVAELTRAIAECLIYPRYGQATAQTTTTTITDANLDEPDGLFDGGTIWITSGMNAGKMAKITTWNGTTHVFTLATAILAAGQGAIQYAALDGRYPMDQLIAALNTALKELGPFDKFIDTTTIVAGQAKYTLPVGHYNVKRVQFAVNDAEPYQWTAPYRHWKEQSGELHFSPYRLPDILAGNKMRIWVSTPHSQMLADTDTVTNDVHPQRIAWLAAWHAARSRLGRGDTADAQTKEAADLAYRESATMQRSHPVKRMPKDETWQDLP